MLKLPPTPRQPGPSPRVLVLLALVGLGIIGCAEGSQSRRPGGLAARIDPQLSAQENLQHLAAAEAVAWGLAPLDVPTPSGVDPQVLAPRSQSDTLATLSLDDALRVIVAQHPSVNAAASEIPSVDASARAEALRHYVKGRDAALNDRFLVAITELRQAAELDPYAPNILRRLARSYLHPGELNRLRAARIYSPLLHTHP